MKRCSQCGEDKPLEDFPLRGVSERGRARCPFKAHCKLCQANYRRAFRERQRDRAIPAVDREIVQNLPVGPIRAWLAPRVDEFEDYTAFGRYVGLGGETIGRLLLGKQPSVSLDTVDKIVVAFGRPDMLGILYPSLYDFDGAVAA